MEANFWKKRWEEGKIAFHKDHFNPHLVEYWDKVIKNQQGTVFVPLCGKSLDLLYFGQKGFSVLGIELSHLAVEEFFYENKISFEKQNKLYTSEKITLFCDDFFNLKAEALEQVTSIYDRASLIALPPEMRLRYANKITSLFSSGVEYFLLVNEFDDLQVGPPFGVNMEMIESYFGESWHIEKFFEREEEADQIDVHPGVVKKKINRGLYLRRK